MMSLQSGIRALIGLLLVMSWGIAGAQEDNGGDEAEGVLVLFSIDAERPLLFQALEPGAAPITADFVSHLELPLESPHEQPVIYLALHNTGWSGGALGLIADSLDPEEAYVALELWERMGNRVLRDDGSGLMFPLVYTDDLDGEETPGFRLDLLTDQGRTFAIYRVVEETGLPVRVQIPHLNGVRIQMERTSVQIDPAPVLGDLLLDAHIIALPQRP